MSDELLPYYNRESGLPAGGWGPSSPRRTRRLPGGSTWGRTPPRTRTSNG